MKPKAGEDTEKEPGRCYGPTPPGGEDQNISRLRSGPALLLWTPEARRMELRMEEVASSHRYQAGLLWLLVVRFLFVWGCLGNVFCLFWPEKKKKKSPKIRDLLL